MPDPELERLIGPDVEPTEQFLSSLRERVTDEWRGARPTRAKRRHWVRVAIAAAAVVALVGGAIALFGRDTHQSVGPAVSTTTTTVPDADDLQIVAEVVFAEPTDAWVSISEGTTVASFEYVDTPGRHVVFQRDGAWFVGFFDERGLVTETPMDTVPAGERHDISWTRLSDGSETIMIDWYTYRLTADGWVQGGRIEVDMAMPPHVDADRSTAQAWVATYYGVDWTVPTPVGWDGQPPTFAIVRGSTDGTYDVAMVAHTSTESVFWSLGADGSVVSGSLKGTWSLLNADEERLELATIDPARRDYSVVRVDWSTVLAAPPLEVPPGALGVRWAIVEFNGAKVERSPMPWFRIEEDGTLRGFDGCAEFIITAGSEGSAVPEESCVPVRPDPRALGLGDQTSPPHLVGNDFQAVVVDGTGNVWSASGRFTVAGSGSSLTLAPDGWLSVGNCANVAIWQVPDAGGDLTITPVDGASLSAGCGSSDIVSLLAEPGLQLSDGWLSSDATVLQLKRLPANGGMLFGFSIGTATLLDGPPLSSTAEIATFPGGVGATMTPNGRIFVSINDDEGWSVQEYVDGEFRPTGLVGLANGVFSGTGEDLYVRENEALVVFSETDTGWVQRETVPAQGECYMRRTAYDTECGAHAAITPPSEVTGVRVTGKSVELWNEGRSIVYEAEFADGEEINCDSDVCISEYTYIPGGGAVWAPYFYPSIGEAAAVAAVLRPGLEPVVVTFGPVTESNDPTIIGVIGDVIHVLRWTGDSYRLESFQLPPAGPGPSFQP